MVGCSIKEKIEPSFESERIFNSSTNSRSSAFSDTANRDPNLSTNNDTTEITTQTVDTTTTEEEAKKPFYVEGSYFFEDMDIDKPVDSRVNIINGILNNIFSIIVRIGGNFEVVSDPIPLDLSDLDPEVVKELYVYNIDLSIVDPENTKGNLKFMKEIVIKLIDKENPEHELIAINFKLKDEKNKEYSKKCNYKCLRIPVSNKNLLDFVGDSTSIMVQPIVKLGSAPKDNFAVKGAMKFKVGLNLDM